MSAPRTNGEGRTRGLDAEQSGEDAGSSDFVTMRVGHQLVGLPILSVQDILAQQKLTVIPRAPAEVAGSLNLRGRIVTAIDVRRRLGLPPREEGVTCMNVVVDHHGELYSLIIDSIGDVLGLQDNRFERVPPTLDKVWRDVSIGVFRLDHELLVILDVERVLNFFDAAA